MTQKLVAEAGLRPGALAEALGQNHTWPVQLAKRRLDQFNFVLTLEDLEPRGRRLLSSKLGWKQFERHGTWHDSDVSWYRACSVDACPPDRVDPYRPFRPADSPQPRPLHPSGAP